ncbi:MAG: pilus assembly protein PilM, partial [Planctomycetes bacterium]|nr:pilus assembly protein PilM [Planctomycetota bacterium]
MTRYVGLDLDRDSLRMAVFEGSPKKFALVDFIEESVEGESELERAESVRAILSEFMESKQNRGADFVTAMDSRQMILREISVPFTRDDQIAKTVRFEAETYLHAFSIDDVIIEYLKCSETDDSSRLLICAADKKKLAEHLAELKLARVDPTIVELDATALSTSFANTPTASDELNTLLVQVDDSATRLVFLQRGKVVKVRSVWSRNTASASSSTSSASFSSSTTPEMPRPSSAADPSGDASRTRRGSPTGAPAPDEIARRFEAIEKSLEDLDQDDEPADDVPFVVLSAEDYDTLKGPEDVEEPAEDETEVDIDALIDARSRGEAIAGDDDGAEDPEEVGGKAIALATTPDVEEGLPGSAANTALARFAGMDPLEKLVLEIQRTFAAYLLSDSLDLIVVTGSCAERLGVVGRLREEFEVDVTSFDIGDSYPIEWNGEVEALSQRGAVACGLGLRALGRGSTTFDLRKEEFRYEKRFARMMPALTLVGLLLCVLSLIWAAREHQHLQLLLNENKVLYQYQKDIAET